LHEEHTKNKDTKTVHILLRWKMVLKVAFRLDIKLLEIICKSNAWWQNLEGACATEPELTSSSVTPVDTCLARFSEALSRMFTLIKMDI